MKYQKQEIKGLGLISFTQARMILANETLFKLNGLNYLVNGRKHNKETWLKFVSNTFGIKRAENKIKRIEGYVLFDDFAAKKGFERCSVLSKKYPSLRHLLLGGKLRNQKTIDEYSLVFGVPQDILRNDGGFLNWLESQISK